MIQDMRKRKKNNIFSFPKRKLHKFYFFLFLSLFQRLLEVEVIS